MLNFIASWRREREAVRELSRLSDRALADLGIARADIRTVAQVASSHRAVADRDPVGMPVPAWVGHVRGSVAA